MTAEAAAVAQRYANQERLGGGPGQCEEANGLRSTGAQAEVEAVAVDALDQLPPRKGRQRLAAEGAGLAAPTGL